MAPIWDHAASSQRISLPHHVTSSSLHFVKGTVDNNETDFELVQVSGKFLHLAADLGCIACMHLHLDIYCHILIQRVYTHFLISSSIFHHISPSTVSNSRAKNSFENLLHGTWPWLWPVQSGGTHSMGLFPSTRDLRVWQNSEDWHLGAGTHGHLCRGTSLLRIWDSQLWVKVNYLNNHVTVREESYPWLVLNHHWIHRAYINSIGVHNTAKWVLGPFKFATEWFPSNHYWMRYS